MNKAQKELLNSFFSHDGIYIESIKEDTTINLGTKILYLKRAISNSCDDFVNCLDNLYNPNLIGGKKAKHIELIRGLKIINDIYNNNLIKYDEFGLKKTLDHYFSSLGPIDERAFQIDINETIEARINDFSCNQENTVKTQKIIRALTEIITPKQTAWRMILDLPEEQQEQPIRNNIIVRAIIKVKKTLHNVWCFLLDLIGEEQINEDEIHLQREESGTYDSDIRETIHPTLPILSDQDRLQVAINRLQVQMERMRAHDRTTNSILPAQDPIQVERMRTRNRTTSPIAAAHFLRREETETPALLKKIALYLVGMAILAVVSYRENQSSSAQSGILWMMVLGIFIAMLKRANEPLQNLQHRSPFYTEITQENMQNRGIDVPVSSRLR